MEKRGRRQDDAAGGGGMGGGRPGAAAAATDAESGTEGGDERPRALKALEVMRQRGLIDDETYRRRRAALEAEDAPG